MSTLFSTKPFCNMFVSCYFFPALGLQLQHISQPVCKPPLSAKEVNVIHCNAAIAVCARGGLWLHAIHFLGMMKKMKMFLGYQFVHLDF